MSRAERATTAATQSRQAMSRTEMSRAEMSRAEMSRTGTSRTGTSRTGTSRTGTSRTGTSRTGTSRTGTRQSGTRQSETPTPRPNPLWTLGLLRSELRTTFRRWRTLALLGVLTAVPVLVGIAVKLETSDGGTAGPRDPGAGPAFIAQVTNNGLFLVFTALAATLPFFLPMAIGVVAGDAIAGEANSGTLRYLLVAPAGRTRLLLTKYATTLTFCLAATLVVAVSALTVGALLFPLGDLTTISGTRITFADGLLRALLIALVVAASLIGVAALGLFVSTLTSSGIAAMATTVGLLITVQIVDQIPQLHAIQPYLFPHYWLSFADLMREPVYWTDITKNLELQTLYAAVFGSAAWARFTTRDITA